MVYRNNVDAALLDAGDANYGSHLESHHLGSCSRICNRKWV